MDNHESLHSEDPEYEAALAEALGDSLPAQQLFDMKETLLQRRHAMQHEFDTADEAAEREKLRQKIEKLEGQIKILAEEAEISKFIEDAVRVGMEMRRSENG